MSFFKALLTIKTRTIKPVEGHLVGEETSAQRELRELKGSLKDVHPVSELVSIAKSVDQVTFT